MIRLQGLNDIANITVIIYCNAYLALVSEKKDQ